MWLIAALLGCPSVDRCATPGACPELCANGVDDDRDGYRDCADPQCADRCVEICGNGRDDDGDGRADCLDAGCGHLCGEDCTNGADDDGDWIADCADIDCASTCDGDGDGVYGPQVGGDDCDDADADVSPEATEVPYDGVDNDCDPGSDDRDADGDGVAVEEDCDDTLPARYPGAPEVCGDGVVNDCDAAAAPTRADCFGDRALDTADVTIRGVEPEGWLGGAVAGGVDADGDGWPEVLVGAYGVGPLEAGAAYLLEAPFARSLDARVSGCELTGTRDMDWAGAQVAAVGDLDGNGRGGFAVGARYEDNPGDNAGRIYLLFDACSAGPIAYGATEITGDAQDQLGVQFAPADDLTGDGLPDLIAGAPYRNDGLPDQGAVLLFAGPITGPVSSSDAVSVLYGTRVDELAGSATAAPGDLDGDGLGDLAVGAPFGDLPATDAGVIYTVLAPIPAGGSLADHPVIAPGQAGDRAGSVVLGAGDWTGDGRVDLLVTAPFADGGGADAGAAWILDFAGPTPVVAATVSGEAAGDTLGTAAAWVPDLDGDGLGELALGAPGHDAVAANAGLVAVWFGGAGTGTQTSADADIRLFGTGANDYAGAAVATAGDVDGDGFADLLVGAPFHDTYGPSDGAAYVVTFGP